MTFVPLELERHKYWSVLLTYPPDSLYSFSDKRTGVPQGSQKDVTSTYKRMSPSKEGKKASHVTTRHPALHYIHNPKQQFYVVLDYVLVNKAQNKLLVM